MTTPTQAELGSLSEAINRLWELDVNRLQPGTHYSINLQGYKKVFQENDAAAKSLFNFVDKQHFFSLPTYAAFYALLDNYERETGNHEVVTEQEKQENRNFINQIMKTDVMKYAHQYLVAKGKSQEDLNHFKQQLYDIWFALYSRKAHGPLDSSGFEHVFVGEVADGKVVGFHNWIQLFLEEARGHVDYKGYIMPRNSSGKKYRPTENERMVSVNFSWKAEGKGVSGTFLGTSPEFEVAMYTLCFLCGEEDTEIQLLDYKINIKCYKQRGHLGTSFPELLGKI